MQSFEDSDGPITGINVTPLVDIVLVVLIIFMATAPMISRRAVKVDVPKVAKHERMATEAIAVALDKEHQLTVGGKPVTRMELLGYLARAVAAREDQAVTLSADRTLPYGEVAELLDAVRGAGVRKVGLEVARK
ncbi:MAG: biopolymer transporter ExbD [Elusimicrobiota bacterium]|nr:biopolymer transporter ExbD [Elusimicrobiota bacterium]